MSLLITSPALTPILLASSPTLIASPTLIRRLIAFGVVISVFFILTGAAFFSSRHLDGFSSPRSTSIRRSFRSTSFLIRAFFRGAWTSPIRTSTGGFAPFFFGFSASGLPVLSTGGGISTSLTIFRSGLAGNSFLGNGGAGLAASGGICGLRSPSTWEGLPSRCSGGRTGRRLLLRRRRLRTGFRSRLLRRLRFRLRGRRFGFDGFHFRRRPGRFSPAGERLPPGLRVWAPLRRRACPGRSRFARELLWERARGAASFWTASAWGCGLPRQEALPGAAWPPLRVSPPRQGDGPPFA